MGITRVFSNLLCCGWLSLYGPAVLADTDTPADIQVISKQIDDIREQHQVSAAAVLVVDREQVLFEHYSGVDDWQKQNPLTAGHWMRIGSVTKAFTGLALLKAQREGLLKLDQDISELVDYQPWQYQNPWSQTPITSAQLMEHTAGWLDMSGLEFDSKDPSPLSLEQAMKLRPESRVSQWQPGWHSSYSNSGPGVAAWVVEQQAGQSFDAYIKKAVFDPLKMPSASLLLEDDIATKRVTGYNTDGHSEIPYWHIVYRPSGGMNVKPRDMARFLQMLLNRGRLDGETVFSEEEIRRMEIPTTTLAAKSGLDFGYGLGIYASVHKGQVLYGHGGDADGYLAHFAYSLDSGRGYFVVINAFNHRPLRAMRNLLADYILEGLARADRPAEVRLSEALLQPYTGVYHQATTRFPSPGWQERRLVVAIRDGSLQIKQGDGRWQRLYAVNKQHFRRSMDPVATRAFIPLKNGDMVYQDPNNSWLKKAD